MDDARTLIPDAIDLSGRTALITGGTGAVVYALMQPARCDVVGMQLRPHRQVI
jgi:hypothetical protein